jgi:hypothetical protein
VGRERGGGGKEKKRRESGVGERWEKKDRGKKRKKYGGWGECEQKSGGRG